jgi:hypothetical protein
LAAVTIACGFIAWWSFVIVAFVSAFYLQRRFEALGPIRLATFAPATGWLFACLARDLFEDGRISAKLASMLHLNISVAVYAAVFLLVCLPSFFAAYSGATVSKSFR